MSCPLRAQRPRHAPAVAHFALVRRHSTHRMKSHRQKKTLLVLTLLVVSIALYFYFFTPRAWRWRTANLQVHLHSVAYPDPISGQPRWDETGFGWRKRDVLFSGWLWRSASGDDRHGGKEFTKMRIVGVTPQGVSIRVVHQGAVTEPSTSTRQFLLPPMRGRASMSQTSFTSPRTSSTNDA